MQPRFLLFPLLLVCVLAQSSFAADPKSVALDAIDSLFIENDLAGFKAFVAPDAVQGDMAPGSAVEKLAKQRQEMLESVDIAQIIFFGKNDIVQLRKLHPDDLWTRVQNHIGDRQGVLVKLALSGELAKHARAAGNDPRDVAMMTFILDNTDEPKIVHVDDN